MTKRYPILNIWVDSVDMRQALDKVVDFVEKGDRPHTIFATNPEKNFSVPEDPFLYDCFKNSDLLIPDGIGMVLAARVLYGKKLERVPGCEFMQEICKLGADKGYRIFIYGAKEEVNQDAVRILRQRYPSIEIVGNVHGYWPEDKMDSLVEQINDTGAQILFLALGSPRQEKWFAKYKDKLKTVRVCQGIGGTLDVIAGNVKRAPQFYCKYGLEWLYRLMADPKRLKRQRVLPVFAAQVLWAKLTGFGKGKV
ncbi:MAG: WecB/TagA/CpsF family glycosyltransferase [Desulfobulbaceae bacterium]|nr:WecB/TagA/CpsF family glycosyltransferase [Desulfobulbaceae bacterium]